MKNFLIRSNLRLVVSIAKRHMKPRMSFFEMVSDGNMSLIRAIEKFDYTKGNKFSTYATWAIMKNYARSIPAEHTHAGPVPDGQRRDLRVVRRRSAAVSARTKQPIPASAT